MEIDSAFYKRPLLLLISEKSHKKRRSVISYEPPECELYVSLEKEPDACVGHYLII